MRLALGHQQIAARGELLGVEEARLKVCDQVVAEDRIELELGRLGKHRREIGALWSDSLNAFVRLYAFGADAYYLVKQLGKLRAQHYAEFQGVTGSLSLNENNRINRRLMWARFNKGTPRKIESDSKSLQQ